MFILLNFYLRVRTTKWNFFLKKTLVHITHLSAEEVVRGTLFYCYILLLYRSQVQINQ